MDAWERLYQQAPDSFRFYPNEEFIRFLGCEYLSIPMPRRGGIRILEIGSGNGANLWPVAHEGFSAFGIDAAPSAPLIASMILRNKWNVRAHSCQGDIRMLPFGTNCFDCAFDVRCLENVTFTEHFHVCTELWRVLKPGGQFFSFHAGAESWDYQHGGGNVIDRHTFDDVPNPNALFPNIGVICMPTEEDLRAILERSGFVDIQIEEVRKTYDQRSRAMQYWVSTCIKPSPAV